MFEKRVAVALGKAKKVTSVVNAKVKRRQANYESTK